MALDTLRRQLAISDEDLPSLGVVPVPPPDAPLPASDENQDLLMPFFRPVEESAMPPEGIRRSLDEEQRLPPFFKSRRQDNEPPESFRLPAVEPSVAETLAPMPSGLRTRVRIPDGGLAAVRPAGVIVPGASDIAAPIPMVNTSAKTGLPMAEAKAIPASNEANPAPPVAGTSGGVKVPPAMEGAGGDVDELGRLSMGQALVRALEGSGSVISGQNLRSGAADTLGERMKQIEALRAKREERSMELAREDEQSSALVQQYKSLAAQGLVPELPLLDKLPIKQAAGLIKTYGSLPGMAAKAAETTALTPVKVATGLATAAGKEAQTAFVVEKTGRVRELLPLEIEQKKAQTAKINADIDLNAKQFALKEKEALAAPGKDDAEKAIKLNDLAEKEKGFGGYVTLANDLSELEAAAPGFVTRGEAPEWLTAAQQSLGQNWPTSADPRVVKFLAAYGKLANAERHRLYGSAQTAGELKSFLQQLNDNPFSSGPETLATQMTSFAGNVGRRATNTLNRYSSVFGAPVVDRVLGGEFRPLYEDGAVFSTFKTPFVAPASTPAAGGAPAPAGATVRIQRKAGGPIRIVPAADKARYLANPDFVEVP